MKSDIKYIKTDYDNVYSKKLGKRICYFARFRYKLKNKRGITPYKNLTTLFGCTTAKQAYEKVFELKHLYIQGINPFDKNQVINQDKLLNHLWDEYIKELIEKKRTDHTINLYKQYYDRYCRKSIGNKEISKITKQELLNIVIEELKGKSLITKNRLKLILSPIFDDAVENEVIPTNFLKHRTFLLGKYVPEKPKVSQITNIKHIDICKLLYKYIPKYPTKNSLKEQLPIFTLLNLMTGHRYGELANLTTENLDLDKKMIKAYKKNTKTKIDTYYPYPEECHEYFLKFKDLQYDNIKLFPNIIPSSYGRIFKVIWRETLKENNIKYFNIVAHDFRQLMLNSMISLGIDSNLANKICLDHSYNQTLDAYLDIDFNLKLELYNIYWKAMRN
ncbi:tyrosine-type recombinase/integrase [Aliarcobacter cryaerophilus]|uniref:tyrosine-type recombinase/integrase n=1 Tax=Aliarcobacter cryaerophilus TaxID=28198 RepID=UPI0021B5DE5D|nr:tyrosine-type recombinase/integrase [Aliarcobacter cryaerophilus]MCT7525414.1 tyrosine-type recombinase/integrase [Aliarcobacter cryaerophilus]